MVYGVYSIFDKAAGVYTAPTIDLSDASAKRGFEQLASNAGSVMNFKPVDFDLYKIGEFNVESGKIEAFTPPVWIATGKYIGGEEDGV